MPAKPWPRVAAGLAVVGLAAGVTIAATSSSTSHGPRPGAPAATRPRYPRQPPIRVEGALRIASRYLGIRPSHLARQLRAGRSLGEIADGTPGHSAAGLVVALVNARGAAIREALAAGRISPTVAHLRLSRVAVLSRRQVEHRRPKRR